MTRSYRRDSMGRFAGGGGSSGSAKGRMRKLGLKTSATSGRVARSSAKSWKSVRNTAKLTEQSAMRQNRSSAQSFATMGAKRKVSTEQMYAKDMHSARRLQQGAERVRRSALRRGARRGGQG
jgi:hypothetical protein